MNYFYHSHTTIKNPTEYGDLNMVTGFYMPTAPMIKILKYAQTVIAEDQLILRLDGTKGFSGIYSIVRHRYMR